MKEISGKKITLNNGTIKKRSSLLIVPGNTISTGKNIIKDAKQKRKTEVILQAEGIDENNIVSERRVEKDIVKPLAKRVSKTSNHENLIGKEFIDEGVKYKILKVYFNGIWKVDYVSTNKKKEEFTSTLKEVEEWLKQKADVKDKSHIVASNILNEKRNRKQVLTNYFV